MPPTQLDVKMRAVIAVMNALAVISCGAKFVKDPPCRRSSWHKPRNVRARPGEEALIGEMSKAISGSVWGKFGATGILQYCERVRLKDRAVE
jgi:hypothetical protein